MVDDRIAVEQQAAEPSASSSGSSSSAKAEEPAKPKMSEAELYEKTLEAVMKMRVSEMKKELDLLKVDSRGFFEKGDFAQALARARLDPGEQIQSSEGFSLARQGDLCLAPGSTSAATSPLTVSAHPLHRACTGPWLPSHTYMPCGTDCGSQPWQ